MFIFYVLYTKKFNKHYYGFTSDIESRLISHNELRKDWTAGYRPWKLIYTKSFITKHEAMVYEKWMKSGTGREFIKSLPH